MGKRGPAEFQTLRKLNMQMLTSRKNMYDAVEGLHEKRKAPRREKNR
jgi:hypothetical protein